MTYQNKRRPAYESFDDFLDILKANTKKSAEILQDYLHQMGVRLWPPRDFVPRANTPCIF
jgi:hypothetical protein